jgi:argininosuccinate lyase
MDRADIQARDGLVFPGASYVDAVLRPAYDAAKSVLLGDMMDLHRAHLVMLRQRGIVDGGEASAIAVGLGQLDVDAIAASDYTGVFEDLFFAVESRLLDLVGPAAGNLHIARSRNDMGMCLDRMAMRPKLLAVLRAGCELHDTLVRRGLEFADTVTLEHTHTQPAQPSVLGHRWLAIADLLARDIARLEAAYVNLNRSPMGAAALGGTGFDIDRDRVARLLGFPELVENAYDAVAATDYLAGAASAMQLMALNTGRSCVDFLTWCTAEFGLYKVAAPYVQISSIMPQKRNPVSIEHSRSLLSSVVAGASVVLTMMHNTSYGDIVDTEDDMQPHAWRAADTLAGVLRLLTGVLGTIEVNTDLMRARAEASFANATELADTLTRATDLTFKQAHTVVAQLVRRAEAEGVSDVRLVDPAWVSQIAEQVAGRPVVGLDEDLVRRGLDARRFVELRTSVGGVAPSEVARMARGRLELNLVSWVDQQEAALRAARAELLAAVADLVSAGPAGQGEAS